MERVVEANTLLSGLGFESGGLAAAHAVAQALTVVPDMHLNRLHGEMVAIGLLTQLILETKADEARRVAQFFVKVGLPVHFGQLSLSLSDTAQMSEVIEAAMTDVPGGEKTRRNMNKLPVFVTVKRQRKGHASAAI